jgi:hypothetical protein
MQRRVYRMKKRTLVTLLMILIIFFGCRGGKIKSVPEELLGVWKPSEPRYADRSFEFKHNAVIFGLGEGEFDYYAINYLKIKSNPDNKGTVYTINYEDEKGEEYILVFYYSPEDNGVIKLKYQEYIVWKREKNK